MADEVYDFIIVGSGPSGSALAAGIANAPSRPRVLLLEAGGPNAERDLRVDGQRFTTLMTSGMNWGYKTTPQAECNNREIDYSRGRGLGGSSAINFGVYSYGARDDYDEWARLVGDDTFSWDKMQQRFKALESFNMKTPAGLDGGAASKYAAPDAAVHGTTGPLKVGYAKEWEDDLTQTLDVFVSGGWPANPDHNSGNPLGISVLINSAQGGVRTTASDLLDPRPENLTVLTDAPVARVLFNKTASSASEKPKAVGVETATGKTYHAKKEVLLSAGALNTPQILMSSGLGPASPLRALGVSPLRDIPALGQNLRDHMFVPLIYKLNTPHSATRAAFYRSADARAAALAQWREQGGTGDWAKYACELGIGWAKLPGLEQSAEFQALPEAERAFLAKETVPHYEIITHFPIHYFVPGFPDENLDYVTVLVFYYNAQARGEVTLKKPDAAAEGEKGEKSVEVPQVQCNPRFLEHEFDRRVAVDSLREVLRVLKQDSFAKDTAGVISGPKGESDEDLLEYWRQNISSSWHMTGTAKMGAPGDADAVVDQDFRVRGVDGLRVVDMSVVPVLASCHIQAVAYITGVTAAEKIVAEYGL
ncbi:putative glucose-methanol-choline oxidoreductase [Microdochium trichocladiopsis]|uniref:Glucose-methanol-choline oxidoreductase n=1 Tax=Microdochium trichocladiopsis TaxID=1682393 RepID=A0A9P8Y126_9PEZI|nr:putative glucose-methanol-choline oxidoreductase [Microdochium trichocladiopsis]KAH7024877.1 putative glucose-methanol-choline oxidoreductase [Microdochium trichocladiopsis]